MIFPEFIKPGDTIGVTATSGGIVNELKQKRVANATEVAALREWKGENSLMN